MKLDCLPPIIDDDVRVIILGSFPGEESLKHKQYYANPKNHFWKIMGEVIGESLEGLSYNERKQALLRNHIGLWDAYASCKRTGSLDKNIRDATPNDFFVLNVPSLRMIFCNGQKAAKVGSLLPKRPIILPSTSPASTLSLPEKIKEWMKVREYL